MHARRSSSSTFEFRLAQEAINLGVGARLGSMEGQVLMSKRENEANNAFRPSDRPLSEYEEEQKAQRKNLERLRVERLAREKTKSNET